MRLGDEVNGLQVGFDRRFGTLHFRQLRPEVGHPGYKPSEAGRSFKS
jgi:hypothetical protein